MKISLCISSECFLNQSRSFVLDVNKTAFAKLQEKMELEVEAYLRRRYERQVADIEIVEKEDLDLVSP